MKKSIIVFSYYSGMPGVCQAEWVDDRIKAFLSLGYDISLISCAACYRFDNPKVQHTRVPTLSPYGASIEYEMIRKYKTEVSHVSVWYLKIIAKISPLLDKLKLRSGEGRWTWFFPACFAGIFIRSIREKEFIYTTGGPPSAHLAGILLAKIFQKKILCEFQDPLSGKDIGRSKLSKRGLQFFEKLIIRMADCTIYCTRNAMLFARKEYPKWAHKIQYIYPGSLPPLSKEIPAPKNATINITYLGSLYQTRNLDTLMEAILRVKEELPSIENLLEINLYGNQNPDIKERILAFPLSIIKIRGFIDRDKALEKAMEADVLLLIQNTDDRSVTTIPFKTYDYLHTGKLIFALIYKNDELAEMLLKYGHMVCQADDIDAICQMLRKILTNPDAYLHDARPSDLTPDLAVSEMLSIVSKIPFRNTENISN